VVVYNSENEVPVVFIGPLDSFEILAHEIMLDIGGHGRRSLEA